jgi:hypothetical protein
MEKLGTSLEDFKHAADLDLPGGGGGHNSGA